MLVKAMCKTRISRFALVAILVSSFSTIAVSQTISNGNFSSKGSGWGCSPEAIHMETTYGGSNSSNRVAEVDQAAGLCQTVSGFTVGNIYSISFDCSRRTTCGPTLQTMDLTVSGGALSETITRNGGGFSFSQESFNFTATSTSHTFAFTGTVSGTCGLIVDNIEVQLVSVLPVELISFEAKLQESNTVELTWATATELNNDFFTVERSSNGSDWEVLTDIPGAGNSEVVLNYTSYDFNPNATTHTFYRLKQTDFDGTFTYSDIRVVTPEENRHNVLKVFPNPSQDWAIIEGKSITTTQIELINMVGQDMANQVSPTVAAGHIRIDLTNIPNGIYKLRVGQQVATIKKI